MTSFRRQPGRAPADITPLEFSTTDGTEEEQKFVHLFSVDGKEYQLWVNPPATLGLEYLELVKDKGEEAAVTWLLMEMIGEDGYQALKRVKGLKSSDLERILTIAKEHALGEEEKSATGN